MLKNKLFQIKVLLFIIPAILVTVIASRSQLSYMDTIKITPLSVSSDESTVGSDLLWNLFDGDTETVYLRNPVTSRIVVDLGKGFNIKTVKFYGKASYRASVYWGSPGSWTPITNLTDIDLDKFLDSWNSLDVGMDTVTEKLMLELTPGSGGADMQGIREIEIWGVGGKKNIADKDALISLANSGNMPENMLVLNSSPSYAEVSGGSTASDSTFTFNSERDARVYRECYLLYESKGLSSWVGTRQSINGTAFTGGFWTGDSSYWTGQVEPLNPVWLKRGSNSIVFSAPEGMEGSYSIRNVRIIALMDDGKSFVKELSGDGGVQSFYDENLSTYWSFAPDSGGEDVADMFFNHPTQPHKLSIYIKEEIKGKLDYRYLSSGQWVAPKGGETTSLNPFQSGWNDIQLRIPDGITTDGIRLIFTSTGQDGGKIYELSLSGSAAGERVASPALEINSPENGEFYGRSAYISGWIDGPGVSDAEIYIAGQKYVNNPAGPENYFGRAVSKDEAGYEGQTDSEAWQVEVKAVYPGGIIVRQIINLTNFSEEAPLPGKEKTSASGGGSGEEEDGLDASGEEEVEEWVSPGKGKKIGLKGTRLHIPPGALWKDRKIKIKTLKDSELPPLDPGMVNVTAPDHGYRFTPHGLKFRKKVALKMPYDPYLIPAGIEEDEVWTYYYDEKAGHWKKLGRVKVDKERAVVESETDHFTDMINAVLVTPEHPEALTYNPNTIKDIKAADPGAGINLIEPPQANNMGDARLSYPIEIPAGRRGMQPQLSISYNSSGGNGWLGLGWDLSVPSITIDTRWGVPRYNGDKETETYSLNGEMLTPVAHRGELRDRNKDSDEKEFHPRVEGQFRKIIRHGTSPSNYWWEVTDKNGTRNFYGGDGQNQDAGSILGRTRSPNPGVFKWMLKKSIDTNGNTVIYDYTKQEDTGLSNGTVMGYQIYVKEIAYTGHGAEKGAYRVNFLRDRELPGFRPSEDRRHDVTIDARGGFKMVTADLLKRIVVIFTESSEVDGQSVTADKVVRSYELEYEDGAFKKTRLKAIVQKGKDGNEFNRHELEYYDEVTNGGSYQGFDSSVEWGMGDDGLTKSFLSQKVGPSALGGSEGEGKGGSFSLGFGPWATKYLTINGLVGNGSSDSRGILSLMDIDGDNLPDKVYKKGGSFRYHRNTVTPDTLSTEPVTFDSNVSNAGNLGVISEDETQTFNLGVQGYVFGFNIINDLGFSMTTQRSYLSDVNGDGLVDVIDGGRVRFNKAVFSNNSVIGVNFVTTSAGTESPIGVGFINASGMLPVEAFEEIEQQLLEENPLTDAVRRWVAPYDGKIRITGDVKLVDVLNSDRYTDEEKGKRGTYQTADGVRAGIELNEGGQVSPLWAVEIEVDDFSVKHLNETYMEGIPSNTEDINIKKGDTIYFRVQSRMDGAWDEVEWSPEVTYLNRPGDLTNVNGLNPYHYKAGEDFIYGGRISPIDMPFRGTVRFSGVLEKNGVMTDDVTLSVYHVTDDEYKELFQYRRDMSLLHMVREPVIRQTILWDETGEFAFTENPDIEVELHDKLIIIFEIDSNIDLASLTWKDEDPLKLFYVEAFNQDQPPSAEQNGEPLTDEEGNLIGFTPGSAVTVKDLADNYVIQLHPFHEYNFYPDSSLAEAQPDWTVPEMGWLMISPVIRPKFVLIDKDDEETMGFMNGFGVITSYSLDHDSELVFTVKSKGERVVKRIMHIAEGSGFNPLEHSFALPVPKGDRYFFDFSTRDPDLAGTLEGTNVNVHYIRPEYTDYFDNVPLNKAKRSKRWTAKDEGTATILPQISFKEYSTPLSGSVTLNVQKEWTDEDGESHMSTVVNRIINLDSTVTFNPYNHAFDIPVVHNFAESYTYLFRYFADAELAAALEQTGLAIAFSRSHTREESEFTGLTFFEKEEEEPAESGSGDSEKGEQADPEEEDYTGKAVKLIAADGKVALAPLLSLYSSRDFDFDGELDVVVTRKYEDKTNYGEPVLDEDGNPVLDDNGEPLYYGEDYPKYVFEVLTSYFVSIKAGERYNPGAHTFDVPVKADDTLIIHYETDDAELMERGLDLALWTQFRKYRDDPNQPTWAPSQALHSYGVWDIFAIGYRGWSYVGYNGNGEYAEKVIDPVRFEVSTNTNDYDVPTNIDVASERVHGGGHEQSTVFPAIPQPEKLRWFNGDENWWITASTMSPSRMGLDFVRLPRPEDFENSETVASSSGSSWGAGASAVPRLSIVEGEQTTGFGFIVNISHTETPTKGLMDFMDMNGDRFPDVIGGGKIQYTDMNGALGSKRGSIGSSVRKSVSEADSIAPGGTVARAVASAKGMFNPKGGNAQSPSRNSNFGFSGSMGKRVNDVEDDFRDINGDGLPDRVKQEGSNLRVALNTGYDFEAFEPWGTATIDKSGTKYASTGASYNDGTKGFAGSLNLTMSIGDTETRLVDMNGDGLPDRVSSNGTLMVGFNTGNGFLPDMPWTGASADPGSNQSFSLGGGVSFNIPLGPLCIVACFIDINPGVNMSKNTARPESTLQDVNGDGYADYLSSTEDKSMDVAINRTGRTNLLRKVTRPLGADIDIEYKRSGNTYAQPQSRWVMSRVEVNDGHTGDGPDTLLTTYRYEDGYHDRYERDFYGYEKVIEETKDTGSDDALYRQVIKAYKNGNIYEKGLLESETVADADGKIYTRTVNSYEMYDIEGGTVRNLGGISSPSMPLYTIFPQLNITDKYFYEGQSTLSAISGGGPLNAGKYTYTTYTYDELGNVTYFLDAGDSGVSDDVSADITYYDFSGSYIKDRPKEITVTGDGKTYRKRTASYDATGNLRTLTSEIAPAVTGADGKPVPAKVAVSTMTYDGYGNIKTFIGAENKDGESETLTYTYDATVHSYVEKIDFNNTEFTYSSSAEYDYKYGKPLSTTDLNGNVVSYVYDSFGRTEKIYGPYDDPETGIATIDFDYHPADRPAWALTKNKEHWEGSETIDTILYTDGLKRVLQTKKEAEVNDAYGMTVSGKVVFDGLGRSIKQGQPEFESGYQTNFLALPFAKNATEFEYDVLGRETKVTLPDTAFTTVAYGFEDSLFLTHVTDAEGKEKKTLKDLRDAIRTVKEKLNSAWVTTSYGYNPMTEITDVTDDGDNVTNIAYDMLGRRLSINNPDTGLVTYKYDPAGNLEEKVTPNLRENEKSIKYEYTGNRLDRIDYPDMADVDYEYGAPNAEFNRAGRIVKVKNGDMWAERFYGRLGETLKEIKSIRSDVPSRAWPEYTTEYSFDSFGRMRWLKFPDGEMLTYGYDKGGLLDSAMGIKGKHEYSYLGNIAYDEFGQRTKLELGNGTETVYEYYDETRRLKHIVTTGAEGTILQNMEYTYDSVGNIKKTENGPFSTVDDINKTVEQNYYYDDLHRLETADGHYKVSEDNINEYTNVFEYNSIGNILGKVQTNTVFHPSDGSTSPRPHTTYDYSYDYHKTVRPHAPIHIGDDAYAYDANGNMISRINDRTKKTRLIKWDEENRIATTEDQGKETIYRYDDSGMRVMKRGKYGEVVYVNENFVIRNGEVASKHVFAGNTRIATKLVMKENKTNASKKTYDRPADVHGHSGSVPEKSNGKGNEKALKDRPEKLHQDSGKHLGQDKNADKRNNGKGQDKGNQGNNNEKQHRNSVSFNADLPGKSEKGIANALSHGKGHKYGIYRRLGRLGYEVDENGDIVPEGSSGGEGGYGNYSSQTGETLPEEKAIFYYHGDHLGSSSVITDKKGRTYQHLEYFPYGETWVDEHRNRTNLPYKFTGKELDPETGLYYFGARYYEPRISVWVSADPILNVYLDGNPAGGVYYSRNLNFYGYAGQNPLRFKDPDGNSLIEVFTELLPAAGKSIAAVAAYGVGIATGDKALANVAMAGMIEMQTENAMALTSTFSPVPGTGKALKTVKAIDKAGDVVKKATKTGTKYTPGGKFSKATKQQTAERAGHKCEYCGVKTTPAKKSQRGVTPARNEAQTDHIKPATLGGTNSPDNAAHSCRACNRQLSNKEKPSPRSDN